MAALCANDSRLHSADTAADNSDVLLFLRRLDLIFLRLHGLGIERAARKTHSIGKILSICVTLGGGEVEAAAVTADAGLYLLKPILDKLGYPLGVNEELTGNANRVYSALLYRTGANQSVHSTCANHGDINEFLYMRNVIKVAVLGHIHRRMRPIPGVVRSVVRVKHIVARVLEVLCRPLGFLHSASYLNVILTGHSALAKSLHLRLNRIAERNGIILAACLLDSLNDLGSEAIAVLKAASVLVCTLVEELDCKLVKKIALVYRVHLNTVNSCLTAKLSSLCKRLDYLVYLLLGHLGTYDIVSPSGGLGRGRRKLVRGIKYRL